MFHGVVRDESGRPVAGAIVAVASGTGRYREIAARSGPDGSYRLGGVEPGTYELRASHPSLGMGSESAEVSEDGSTEVNFTLGS
jgi:protocatechuate 3,4-dioxygenase beta subunit